MPCRADDPLIDLPLLVRDVVARALVATILFRFLLYACRIVLAPGAPERRVLPLPEEIAALWVMRIPVFGAIVMGGWVVSSALPGLGAPPPAPMAVATLFGLVVLITWIVIFWQRNGLRLGTAPCGLPLTLLWMAWAVLLFFLWISNAMNLFWRLLVCGPLLAVIGIVNRAVNHLLQPSPTPDDPTQYAPLSVLAAPLERGARTGLVMAAVALLLWAWGVSLADVLQSEARGAIVARVAINVILIAAIFDFIWHVSRTAIDTYIACDRAKGCAAQGFGEEDPGDMQRVDAPSGGSFHQNRKKHHADAVVEQGFSRHHDLKVLATLTSVKVARTATGSVGLISAPKTSAHGSGIAMPSIPAATHKPAPMIAVETTTPTVAIMPMVHARLRRLGASTCNAPANRRKASIPSSTVSWKST